jgi:hypothetical protein
MEDLFLLSAVQMQSNEDDRVGPLDRLELAFFEWAPCGSVQKRTLSN